MRRIVTWAMSTVTVLVLLFSYHTSRSSLPVATTVTRSLTSSTGQTAASSSSSGGTSSSSSGSSGSPGGSSSSSGGSSSSSSGSKTVAGDAVMTQYGPVQVKITVNNGKIAAADVLQVPMQDPHDAMINSQAVPIYNSEAVEAQSAQIDTVSGATFTWQGYTQSLQSAIDKAHL